MTKSQEIIDNINGNGGLDMSFIKWNAHQERKTIYEYIYEYVKYGYNCHGNTARAVAKYYI